MNRLSLLIILACLTTHLLASEKTLYEEVIYNKPDIGSITGVYLGDRMLSQQVGEWKECISPKKAFSKKQGGWTGTYKADEPICKRDLSDAFYWPNYINSVSKNGIDTKLNSVRWKQEKKGYSLCQCESRCVYCIKNLSAEDIVQNETFIYKENSFQQTIEYAGRSGDILKLNYSEFSDGFARQAFTREFQVDLSEGNIAAYKGAIIEIVEATNVQIKYKVIRNFASDS